MVQKPLSRADCDTLIAKDDHPYSSLVGADELTAILQKQTGDSINLCGMHLTDPEAILLLRDWRPTIGLEQATSAIQQAGSRSRGMLIGTLALIEVENETVDDGVDLRHLLFSDASMFRSSWGGVNLTGSHFSRVSLRHARFENTFVDVDRSIPTILDSTRFIEVDARDASFYGISLVATGILNSNFRNADLSRTSLRSGMLVNTQIDSSRWSGADVARLAFEPSPGSLPFIASIAEARNLHQLDYLNNPQGLVALRNAFADAGLREAERDVTFAIRAIARRRDWRTPSLSRKLRSGFEYLLFEVPVGYGREPGRALLTMLVLIVPFWLLYSMGMRRKPLFGGVVYKIRNKKPGSTKEEHQSRTEIRDELVPALRQGLQFSVLSAFHIGWRELNVGNWLSRLQSHEYHYVADGWIRSVSGLQSLISVYLLALWALTYFGTPFK